MMHRRHWILRFAGAARLTEGRGQADLANDREPGGENTGD